MVIGVGLDQEKGSRETVLIELDVRRVPHGDGRSSPWTALVIALFTAVTCLGLGVSAALPGGGASAPSELVPVAGAIADRPQPTQSAPVQATARIATLAGGGRVVRIAGQAAVTVRSLDVALIIAGRTAAEARIEVASDATLTPVVGTGVGAAPWSADFALATVGAAGIGDAVATVEVAWPSSPAGPAGRLVLVVSLGDGRGGG